MTTTPENKTLPPAFHAGERAIQQKARVSERIIKQGQRVIRSYLLDQHREFFNNLAYVVLAATDQSGTPIPFLRCGNPGFITTPTDTRIIISAPPLKGESETLNLKPGAKIAMVGIDLLTRRRNRLNGTIIEASPEKLVIDVDQSFGNCAQYIQRRCISEPSADFGKSNETLTSATLSDEQQKIISNADIFFIASRSADLQKENATKTNDKRNGLDVNHRGGPTGFVELIDDQTLKIPDYKGNNYYNTFGNIYQDNRTGLQFYDFSTGDVLTLSGRGEIIVENTTPSGEENTDSNQKSTNRFFLFYIKEVRQTTSALPYTFTRLED